MLWPWNVPALLCGRALHGETPEATNCEGHRGLAVREAYCKRNGNEGAESEPGCPSDSRQRSSALVRQHGMNITIEPLRNLSQN